MLHICLQFNTRKQNETFQLKTIASILTTNQKHTQNLYLLCINKTKKQVKAVYKPFINTLNKSGYNKQEKKNKMVDLIGIGQHDNEVMRRKKKKQKKSLSFSLIESL